MTTSFRTYSTYNQQNHKDKELGYDTKIQPQKHLLVGKKSLSYVFIYLFLKKTSILVHDSRSLPSV